MSKFIWAGGWKAREPSGPSHSRTRTVITPSGGIMRGKFPSRKTGRMVHHEGMLELAAVYLFEASSSIDSYREQPVQITYPDGDRIRRYTPDFELALKDGSTVWVEVKPRSSLAHDDVKHKLAQVAVHMRRSGKTYVVLDDSVLRQEPRLSNIKLIWHMAPAHRPTRERAHLALTEHAGLFPLSMSPAIKLLEAHDIDVYSLLLMGMVTCDLDVPINGATLLNLSEEADHVWFSLSGEHGF
ncbi:TnsA endonuclease N-terminal domain-containing protein [Diaphorobacter sp.]|uniref:TnsA endonuclease N-terminal domain-containing protein n=1 Tax=Diaphorobacter sp. TaxID=1934310 RepID=UPI0028B1BB6C|nr:TnsA endonuclease N-terminal domain-containing protein [Diaphorobacter sp.]